MSMFSTASSNVTPGSRDRGLERIQVDDNKVNRLHPLRREGGKVIGNVAAREDAAVELRMKRLDPSPEDLRLAGIIGDFRHGQTRLDERGARAAAGEQMNAVGGQRACQFQQPPFLGNTEQCSTNRHHLAHASSPFVRNGTSMTTTTMARPDSLTLSLTRARPPGRRFRNPNEPTVFRPLMRAVRGAIPAVINSRRFTSARPLERACRLRACRLRAYRLRVCRLRVSPRRPGRPAVRHRC